MKRWQAVRAVVKAVLAGTLMLGAVIPSWATQTCTTSANQSSSAPSITVRVEPDAHAVVGKPIIVHWDVQGQTASGCTAAGFLVLATPASVRLAGEGFFAVPGGAPTPFGINAWPTSTRIFVPLQLGEFTRSGTISITPYVSGALSLQWKVISIRNGSAVDAPGSASAKDVAVASGNPALTVADPVFFAGRPRQTLIAPDGSVRLEDYGDHFRLVDIKNVREMFQGAGAQPAFSPTGRFVYFFNARTAGGDADWTALQVLDRATSKIIIARERGEGVGQDTIVSLRWGIGDAILSLGTAKGAFVETYATLIDRVPYAVSLGPNCCDAITEKAAIHIDLENLLLTYSAKERGFDTTSVESLAFSNDGAMQATSPNDFLLISQLRKQDQANPDSEHTAPDGRGSFEIQDALSEQFGDYLNTHRVKERLTDQVVLKASGAWDLGGHKLAPARTDSLQVGVTQARFVRSADQLAGRDFTVGEVLQPNQGTLAGDRFAQRLIELKLPLQDPAVMTPHSPPHAGEHVLSVAAANKLTSTVIASVPQAKQFFSSGDRLCNPSTDNKEDGNKIAPASIIDMREFKDGDLRVWLIMEGCTTSPSVSDYFARLAIISEKQPNTPPQLVWLNAKPIGSTTVNDALGLAAIPVPVPAIKAELYEKRYLLLSIGDRSEVLDYDLNGDKVAVFRAENSRTGAAFRLYRTRDGRIVRLDRDGSVHIFLPSQQREYLSGRYIDDELVVFNDAGFYDGTDEGARYVYFSFPGLSEPASLRQFRASLHKSFIENVLVHGGAVPSSARPDLQPPPIATLSLTTGHSGSVSIDVTATSPKGLSTISIFTDGRLVRKITASGNSFEQHLDIVLVGQALWVTAQAVDMMGTESLPVSASIPAYMRVALAKPRVHVIAVGTDVYDDQKIPRLHGAVADAKAFVLLVAQSKLYATDKSANPILNSSQLKEDLLQQIDSVARSASGDDTTMVLISGHGMVENGQLFLASRITQYNHVAATSIEWSAIATALARIPGRLIVFLDTCHSGASEESNDIATTSLISQNSIVVVSASKGRQVSNERQQEGMFTGAMSRLVKQDFRRIDTNGNGAIELDELYRALKIEVLTESNGTQTPWIARNGFVGPVPIF